MTNKERYRSLCKKEKSIPLFSRDWWMDTVCGEENWDVFLVETGGNIVGAMPYYYLKKRGRIYIGQPQLTQKNGIWISYPPNQKYSTSLNFETQIMKQIIRELESLNISRYDQNFNYSFSNWLPFYWNSFKQSTRYTYVIENVRDIEAVYSSLSNDARNNIKRAEKKVQVKEDLNIEKIYELSKRTFEKQDMTVPYTLDFLTKLDSACIEQNCRKSFYAEDSHGNIHSAVYIVWDENSAYYIAGGGDPEFRNSEATTLLLWKAIQFSGSVTKSFDFEGSMIEPIERFFRNFGAVQKPYFNIYKDYNETNIFYVILKDIYHSSLFRKLFKRKG